VPAPERTTKVSRTNGLELTGNGLDAGLGGHNVNHHVHVFRRS